MHGKRGKKTRYAKNPVFENKLHNEVATYSKSTTMRHICITNYLLNLQYLISKYKTYLIYRQCEKRLHLKYKQFAFSVQKTGDFASDPTL